MSTAVVATGNGRTAQCYREHSLLKDRQQVREVVCVVSWCWDLGVWHGCSEMLRYFKAKGEEKAKVAPNLTAIFEHFNRVSH